MDGGRLKKKNIANTKIADIKLFDNGFRITLLPYRAEFSLYLPKKKYSAACHQVGTKHQWRHLGGGVKRTQRRDLDFWLLVNKLATLTKASLDVSHST